MAQKIYVLTFTFVGVPGRRPVPGGVVVERQTLVAVRACGVVLALAHPPLGAVERRGGDALGSVAVALAPGAHGDVGDRVEIGLEDAVVAEVLVSEGVQPVQGDHYLGGRHPFLGKKIDIIGTDQFLESYI